MTERARIVTVQRARSPVEAQVIVAVLRGAGIPAHVEGSLLEDEFAASQRSMGLTAVDVLVPHEAYERARRVLEEARLHGAFLGGPDEEGEDSPTEDELRRN